MSKPIVIVAFNCDDLPYDNKPVENTGYTIRDIFLNNGHPFILLNEVINTKSEKTGLEPGFHYSRFYYNDDRKFVLDFEYVEDLYKRKVTDALFTMHSRMKSKKKKI